MRSDWPEINLSERCSVKSSKRIFAKEYVESGIPFFRSKDVIEKSLGTFTNYDLYISEKRFSEIKSQFGSPEKGDLLISSVGNRSGQPYVVQDEGNFYFKDGNILWLSEFKDLDSNYLAYWLKSELGQISLSNIMIGSAQKALTIEAVRKLKIRVPPIEFQKYISRLLGNIDEKIELNRQINQTLESMVRVLFKSWFVDFDPVIDNALAAGNEIPEPFAKRAAARQALKEKVNSGHSSYPTLPEDIRQLFPNTFELVGELGWIPQGWELGTMGDLIVQRNERIAPSEYTRSIPYVPIDCISSKSLFLQVSKSGNEAKSSLIRFQHDDVLFGAMRPYFHKVCIAPFEGTTRTTAFVLSPLATADFSFCTMLLHQNSTIEYANITSTGTTIPYAKWKGSMENMPISIPARAIREKFDEINGIILRRIPSKYFENQSLTEIRDLLLPKLLSGELRIPGAEGLAEEAGI